MEAGDRMVEQQGDEFIEHRRFQIISRGLHLSVVGQP